jgi:hypothetical protein
VTMRAARFRYPEPLPSEIELARARCGDVVHAPLSPKGTAVCTFGIWADDPRVTRRVRRNRWARAITCPLCLGLMAERPGLGRPPTGLLRWLQLRRRGLVRSAVRAGAFLRLRWRKLRRDW